MILKVLSVIAEYSEVLESILLNKNVNKEGCYMIRLCDNGEWKTLILDDYFPVCSRGILLFGRAARNQLWVPLIIKAYAKLRGSYAALCGNFPTSAFSTLTGLPCDSIDLKFDSVIRDSHEIDLVWAKLISAKESNYLMCCVCYKTYFGESVKRGLYTNHVYSLLNAVDLMGYRLLQLR
jgi:calpain-15